MARLAHYSSNGDMHVRIPLEDMAILKEYAYLNNISINQQLIAMVRGFIEDHKIDEFVTKAQTFQMHPDSR